MPDFTQGLRSLNCLAAIGLCVIWVSCPTVSFATEPEPPPAEAVESPVAPDGEGEASDAAPTEAAKDGAESVSVEKAEKAADSAPGTPVEASAPVPTPPEAPPAAVPATRPIAVFVNARRSAQAQEAALVQGLLREQLVALPGVRLVEAHGVPAMPGGVDELLEKGFRALHDPKLREKKKDAIDQEVLQPFTEALALLQGWSGPVDRRAMAKAFKGIGLAHLLKVDIDGARKAIETSLNLWPDQKALEYAYTPDAYRIFGAIEKERSQRRGGSVVVSADPPGAEVFVDGLSKGEASGTIENLQAGTHWLAVAADGYQRTARFIEVTQGGTLTLEVGLQALAERDQLSSLVSSVTKQRSAKRAAGVASELQSLLSGAEVLALQLTKSKTGYRLTGWHHAAEPLRVQTELSESGDIFASAKAMLTQVLAVQDSGGEAAESLSLGGPPQSTIMRDLERQKGLPEVSVEEPEFYETWWFWTSVGVVVVGTTAAVLAVVLSEDDPPPPPPMGSVDLQINTLP